MNLSPSTLGPATGMPNENRLVNLHDPRTLQAVQALLPGLLGAEAAARLSDEALAKIMRALAMELSGPAPKERDLTDVMSSVIDQLGLNRALRHNQGDQVNVLLDIVDGIKVRGAAATLDKVKQAAQDGKIRGLFEKPIVNHGARARRNGRCGCGSGKKYKQCCLGKR
jgi:hypothetical protein